MLRGPEHTTVWGSFSSQLAAHKPSRSALESPLAPAAVALIQVLPSGRGDCLFLQDEYIPLLERLRIIRLTVGASMRIVVPPYVVVVLALGCGRSSPPLTTDPAQAAVEASLGAWLKGGTPQQSGLKDVEMSDPDWRAGYELVGFKTTKLEGEQDKRQVHVILELQDAKGKAMEKQVVYLVKTGDKT